MANPQHSTAGPDPPFAIFFIPLLPRPPGPRGSGGSTPAPPLSLPLQIRGGAGPPPFHHCLKQNPPPAPPTPHTNPPPGPAPPCRVRGGPPPPHKDPVGGGGGPLPQTPKSRRGGGPPHPPYPRKSRGNQPQPPPNPPPGRPAPLTLFARISSPVPRAKSGSWSAARADSSRADRRRAGPGSVFQSRDNATDRSL